MRRIVVIVMLVLAALTVMAEDVTFLNNRRQWEQLPTATLMNMGDGFLHRMMPDSALFCYSIVANRYDEKLKSQELKQCIRAKRYVGSIYVDFYFSHSLGTKYLLDAEELAKKHHYDQMIPYILMSLGTLYWQLENLNEGKYFNQALSYRKAAFWKAIEVHNTELLPILFANLDFMTFDIEQSLIEKERKAYNNLNIPDSVKMKSVAQTMSNGTTLFRQEKYEEALEMFKKALSSSLDDVPDLNKFNLRVMYLNIIFIIQMRMGSAEALNTITQTRDLILKERPELIAGVYDEFVEYYRAHNNQPLAEKYELLWWRSTDSIAKASETNSVNTVRFLHEIDKMNEEQQALVIKQRHDRQMLWVVSIAALIAIVMLVLLYLSRKRIQQGYRTIYQQNVELLAAEDARQRAAMAEQLKEITVETPKYSHNQMDEDVMDELWQQIVHLMQTSDEIYQDTFSIERLCDMLGAKRAYVSQTINTKAGGTFTTLLNEYRIREACRRMNDTENFGQYTIEGIANSVGYSRSYFVRIFKESTGIPPSAYMKLAKAGNADLPNADPHDSHPDIN